MAPTCPVLYLLDYADLGGGETSLLHLLSALRQLAPSVEPHVVMPQPGAVADALRTMGLDPVVIPYPCAFRRGLAPQFGFAARRAIGGLIRDRGIRLMHANNLFGMVHGGAAAARAGVPCLWTCHGWYEVDRGLKRWFAARHPREILCVSEAVASAVRAAVPKAKVQLDYLGVPPFAEARPDHELRAEVRGELGIGETTPVAAALARFQPVKGHRHLFNALPVVLREIPDLQVLVIGDARSEAPEEIENKAAMLGQIKELGLGGCVRLLGFRDDARRLLRGLDLLVIPSERETFSMVAVEGLEAGIPVIGPDRDGPWEIIAQGCGLRVPPANPAALAEAMLRLLRNPAEAGFSPEAGPARFAALFTVEAHARRVLAAYARLLPGVPLAARRG